MASLYLPLFRTSARSLRRSAIVNPAFSPRFVRAASTKHPAGFTPPTEDDLVELRERVQDFTSMSVSRRRCSLLTAAGREIPAEVAAQTDEQNNFPAEMWKKLGDAG